ncbi:MAG: ABC transporter ATP-binding protein [Planctomycetota bacterium]
MNDKHSLDVLLEVQNLKTYFKTDEGMAKAVDGISYKLFKGETLGIVGESGCGKSVSAMSILRLIPSPPGKIIDGKIMFEGKDLVSITNTEMRSIRGNRISMIFQEPMTSLNPVYTVGNQIMESIILHQKKSTSEARVLTIEMLKKVGIPSPETRIDEYPHQMSGGMKQRIMIAMALVCNPSLLIADEPTTALDVTIQAQILELLKKLQKEYGMSILLITHDLAVIAETADHVAVMYGGKIVEYTDVKTLFRNPKHPYTVGLFHSIPVLGQKKEHLDTIPGMVPSALKFPSGCKFRNRCPHAFAYCAEKEPDLQEIESHHTVSCWLFDDKVKKPDSSIRVQTAS